MIKRRDALGKVPDNTKTDIDGDQRVLAPPLEALNPERESRSADVSKLR